MLPFFWQSDFAHYYHCSFDKPKGHEKYACRGLSSLISVTTLPQGKMS